MSGCLLHLAGIGFAGDAEPGLQIAPSTPAIKAFLRLNQMGADFSQVRGLWLQLWLQTAIYDGLVWWLLRRRLVRS